MSSRKSRGLPASAGTGPCADSRQSAAIPAGQAPFVPIPCALRLPKSARAARRGEGAAGSRAVVVGARFAGRVPAGDCTLEPPIAASPLVDGGTSRRRSRLHLRAPGGAPLRHMLGRGLRYSAVANSRLSLVDAPSRIPVAAPAGRSLSAICEAAPKCRFITNQEKHHDHRNHHHHTQPQN